MARDDSSMAGQPKYERVENDFYPTESNCTEAAIQFMRQHGLLAKGDQVIEPACGDGAISKVFIGHGFDVKSSDLYPQMAGANVKDFLTHKFEEDAGFDGPTTLVITNPPYKLPWINQFMARINDMVHNDGVVGALLMRNEVDCAKSRRVFFQDNPYYFGKLVLTWRPRWIPGSTGSPRHNYSWYFWSPNQRSGEPIIRYGFRP